MERKEPKRTLRCWTGRGSISMNPCLKHICTQKTCRCFYTCVCARTHTHTHFLVLWAESQNSDIAVAMNILCAQILDAKCHPPLNGSPRKSSLEKWPMPKLKQGKCKIRMEDAVMPENKETLREWLEYVKRVKELIRTDSRWSNWGKCEHQNKKGVSDFNPLNQREES